jgi:hypothetical protein
MGNIKTRPFAAAQPQQKNSNCLGESCACYVKMHKSRQVQADNSKFSNPEIFYRYTGCGLIAQVPWELVKRKKTPETPQYKLQEKNAKDRT